jgi:hypothetical protein
LIAGGIFVALALGITWMSHPTWSPFKVVRRQSRKEERNADVQTEENEDENEE